MPSIKADWKRGLEFSVLQDGHRLTIDGSPEFGGADLGPRPKNLLLTALACCTGMDVVSILRKMKVEDYRLTVEARGEYTEEHPKVFSELEVEFIFSGHDLPRDKIERAVSLSSERYCGVSAMLRHTVDIGCTITLVDTEG